MDRDYQFRQLMEDPASKDILLELIKQQYGLSKQKRYRRQDKRAFARVEKTRREIEEDLRRRAPLGEKPGGATSLDEIAEILLEEAREERKRRDEKKAPRDRNWFQRVLDIYRRQTPQGQREQAAAEGKRI